MIHRFDVILRALLLPDESASPCVRDKGMTLDQLDSSKDFFARRGRPSLRAVCGGHRLAAAHHS
jgi:hypothetical protein